MTSLPVCLALLSIVGRLPDDGTRLTAEFAAQVDRRLDVPAAEQRRYADLLAEALAEAGHPEAAGQFVLLVDRNVFAQAALLFWISGDQVYHFIGASPVSTGNPGHFEYFESPTGVFEHTVENPDFRAEGTRNEFGIRGYGRKGMRVYDFGWISSPRGWGDGHAGVLRLQVHATDPDFLEPQLGHARSKGCIRIPATLNLFIDRYGLLDADYERAEMAGHAFAVLLPDRQPTPWSGRYLVVVDSKRWRKPPWSTPR